MLCSFNFLLLHDTHFTYNLYKKVHFVFYFSLNIWKQFVFMEFITAWEACVSLPVCAFSTHDAQVYIKCAMNTMNSHVCIKTLFQNICCWVWKEKDSHSLVFLFAASIPTSSTTLWLLSPCSPPLRQWVRLSFQSQNRMQLHDCPTPR